MRLLYTTDDGRLGWTKDYIGVEKVPAYAILSHTWGEQEGTFKDLEKHQNVELTAGTLKAGYQKILFCAQQAKRDGLDHFWIDSCCIDKSNSTELSEAINSMFRWYQNAVKCYVYLSDVQNSTLDQDGEFALRRSRWFTRGWTLQELLAPTVVEFFSSEGVQLGNKESLRSVIHEITGVPVEALSGSTLSDFSVDDRFCWAKDRQTTREEDRAYCLLGIFSVHLPLIYGEGEENALYRLRDAVLMKNDKGHNQSSGERLRKVCSWLSAPDPSTNYHKAHKLRQADTGLWLLKSTKFTTWKDRAASRLWLYGIPGCGKTILSSTIIEHLLQYCKNNITMVTVYFYFDFNDAQKQAPELMLRSLLCQLLSSFRTIPKFIDVLFSSCQNGQRQPSPHALLESLRQMLQLFTQVYIVLDALDECTQRQEMMNVLESVAGWQLDNMHLLMTSRQERDIERSLENCVDEEEKVCLQSDVVDKDIQQYVQERLSVGRDLVKWNRDSAMRQEIESALMSGARGMFRWAVCQLDALTKCRNRVMLRKALATLPQTLDQTYDRILTAISEEDCTYAMRILQWLTFSMRPMSIEEIAEVVAVDVERDPAFDRDEVLEDPLEVLNICSSLITVSTIQDEKRPDHTKRIVALAHYSVQEYLVSDRIKHGLAKKYEMHEAECHGVMMNGCLQYLLQLQRPLSGEVIQTLALARYAAEFWSSHLKQTREEIHRWSQAAIGLMSTENPAYLTWIQLYDPDYPWMLPNPHRDLENVTAPLYYAALLGLNTVTKLLLDRGAEITSQGGRDGNALHAASSMGHELIVKMLLENKPDVNAKAGIYGTALQAASAKGHQAIVKLLLDGGADVNQEGGTFGNALTAAASRGHITIVELLVKKSADILRHDREGQSVLHCATNSRSSGVSLVEILLLQGAPVDTVDFRNMTPLHYSVKFGHESIVELLLENGLSIDTGIHRRSWSQDCTSVLEYEPNISCDSAGLTPLHFAALTGGLGMTKFLLQRGADPNALSRYKESPIHLTLRKTLHGPKYNDDWTEQMNRVEGYLDSADPEHDDLDEIYANIRKHREDVLDALLADARTSLTIGDYQHDYPLHCVEYGKCGSVSVVNKLVSRGANPCERNLKQQTALHLASRAGDSGAVTVFLSLGVDPALTDSEGVNAVHHAAWGGNYETIAMLIETRPSLVESKDAAGRNLLHHLLSRTSTALLDVLRLLLEKGVDGSELDGSGNSPLSSYFKAHRGSANIYICQQLLSVNGNSSFVNSDGQNLGHIWTSTWKFHVRILEALNEHGVDLTQKDFQSRTILHCAAIRGNITEENLHYLLHVVGVEINAEDASGKTALQHAAEMASKDRSPNQFDPTRWDRCMRLLSDAGAGQGVPKAIES